MPEAVDDLEAYVAELDGLASRATATRSRFAANACRSNGKPTAACNGWRTGAKAEFFIAPTHMNCDRALDGKVIANIQRLGVPIGVVKDRRALVRSEIASHQ